MKALEFEGCLSVLFAQLGFQPLFSHIFRFMLMVDYLVTLFLLSEFGLEVLFVY